MTTNQRPDEPPRDPKWHALKEIEHEDFTAAVEREKARIRARRGEPWWKRILPFTITIKWRKP